MTVQIYSR